jgi:hypothetical protein
MNTTPIEETRKRLDILTRIARYLEDKQGPIVAARVCGSMSFAQNHAIRPDSDIDLDIFLPFHRMALLNPFLQFVHSKLLFQDDEQWEDLDLIAIDGSYQGVVINIWALNTANAIDIAMLKKNSMHAYSLDRPSEVKSYKTLDGRAYELKKHIQPFRRGYLSDRPILCEGQLLNENYILNNLFFAFPIFGCEYSEKIVNLLWQALLTKYPTVTHEQMYGFRNSVSTLLARFPHRA